MRKIWAIALSIFFVSNYRASRHGTTVCWTLRRSMLRMGPAGRPVFAAACIAVPTWFWFHVTDPIKGR